MLVPVGWKVGSRYVQRPPETNKLPISLELPMPYRRCLTVYFYLWDMGSDLSFTLKTRHPAVASSIIPRKDEEIQKANEEERITINPIIPMQVRVYSETGLSTPG